MSEDTVSKDGTDGLVTVAKVDSRLGDMSRLSIIDRPLAIGTEVCLRSQAESEIRKVRKDAEELLAAKDTENAYLKELVSARGETIKRGDDRIRKLEADNAAQAARIKELEAEFDQAVGVIEDRSSENQALEAKLAAAEAEKQSMLNAMGDMANSNKKLKAKLETYHEEYENRKEGYEKTIDSLEEKLAAAEKALEEADEALQADAIASAHAAIRAVLGGKPS